MILFKCLLLRAVGFKAILDFQVRSKVIISQLDILDVRLQKCPMIQIAIAIRLRKRQSLRFRRSVQRLIREPPKELQLVYSERQTLIFRIPSLFINRIEIESRLA